jgi:hypothetical protein
MNGSLQKVPSVPDPVNRADLVREIEERALLRLTIKGLLQAIGPAPFQTASLATAVGNAEAVLHLTDSEDERLYAEYREALNPYQDEQDEFARGAR